MKLSVEDEFVIISQENALRKELQQQTESYGIGLQSIERLAKIYKGTMETHMDETKFQIRIRLHL